MVQLPPLLTIAEAAEHCRIPLATMRWWRAKKTGPHFGTIGRRVVIRQSTLSAWVDEQMRNEPDIAESRSVAA